MATRLVLYPGAIAALVTGEDVEEQLRRRTLRVERRAKQLCPVDTGRLRSSIESTVGRDKRGLVGIVGSDVEYAPFVELGTSRSPAQPYLRPALEAGR